MQTLIVMQNHTHSLQVTLYFIGSPNNISNTMPYNSKPYTVTKTKGSMVTASRDGHTIVRNSSFFKKVVPELLHIP